MKTAPVALSLNKKPPVDSVPRSPARSVQDILACDAKPPQAVLLIDSPRDMGRDDVSLDRYYTREWHDREIKTVWQKTWQMACREEDIPNVGDTEIYEIVHDSLIIVRTGSSPTDIRAYVNFCLHRGTILCTEAGNLRHIKCPVHGITWGLDGKLAGLPNAWDFPQIDRKTFNLPEAKVGLWAGFVFINFDPNCEPLESYLECLPEHFKAFIRIIAIRPSTVARSCTAIGSLLKRPLWRGCISPRHILNRWNTRQIPIPNTIF